MMRIGGIVSRKLGGVLSKLPTTKYHNFGSFFYRTCSFDATNPNPSNFISQDELPSSDGDFSSSDEESPSSDGASWSLESILNRPRKARPHHNGLVVPLAQVFSVSLHADFDDDDRPCDIYGTIFATNARGVISNLYNRPYTNSELIPNGGILSLNGGLDNNITYDPTTNTTIDLDLNVKSRNTVVIKKKHNLHSFNQDFEDSSNKLIKDIVRGQGCSAVIYYAKFLFAVRAVIKVAIYTKRDTTSPCVDIYGNIALGYGNARKYCSNDDQVRHIKCALFNKPVDQPQPVLVGRTMKLSRSVVAMPAYSSLVIDADISDSHGRLAAGSLEVPFTGPHQKVIDGEFGTIAVTVMFNNPCPKYISEVDTREEDVTETESDRQAEELTLSSVIDQGKNNLPPSLRQQMMTSTPLRGTRSFSSMQNNEVVDSEQFHGAVLTELFSIYVDGTNHEVLAICGSIRIFDRILFPPWTVFERGFDDTEYFSQDKGFIPIEQHKAIDTDHMVSLHLTFADPLNGKELLWSGNSIEFVYVFLMQKPYLLPLGKRVCSYIQGAHGYALLHYIIFESACEAKVEITLFSNQNHSLSLPIRLCGLVVATYNNHTYTTTYEKKYYRSRLFYKLEPEFVELERDMIVPLLKSVIAVPEGVGLVVEVDMEVLSPGNQKDIVFGKKVFNINMSRTTHEKILGKCCGVQISTKFKSLA